VVLIFNPASGGGRSGREEAIARVAETLRGLGHAVETVRTWAAGSAGAQARAAADSGAEVVFACGGDGTVHEVMQGLVGAPVAALGIVPMGSANALARHFGLLSSRCTGGRSWFRWGRSSFREGAGILR
jgi:diacylglycerol kinase family enzyme